MSASSRLDMVDIDEALTFRRLSWKAVAAGVVLAVVTQIVLSLLGIGIGAATIDPLVEADPAAGLGIGAGVWFLGSSILSLALGGWLAGRLSGSARHPDGTIHGVITWAVATIALFLLLSTAAGRLLGGAASLVNNNASLIASNLPAEVLNDPAAAAARAGMDEQTLRANADAMARRTSQTALWSALGLILGGVAAGVGGYLGAARYLVLRPGVEPVYARTSDVTSR